MSINKTFDKYRIQNSKQDTGTIDVVSTPSQNPYSTNARRIKNEWFINNIRDIANIPVDVSDNMKWAYKKKLEDHYNVITLTKDNNSNETIYLFSSNLIYKESKR